MNNRVRIFLSGLLTGLILMWCAHIAYNNHFHATYEEVTAYYVVQPMDTLWDIAHRYYLEDDRHIYFPQFFYDVLQDNPRINAKRGQINPGDMIKIRFFRRIKE